MGIRTHFFIKCISMITALTTSSAACFSTPSVTREINNEVLAIQLEQAANTAVINSNLLTESGQTILINGEFAEKRIPITISCENANFSIDTILAASVTAVSSDESRMTVLLDKQEVVLDGTEQTVYLTIHRNDYIASEEGTEENTEGILEEPSVGGEPVIKEEPPAEEQLPEVPVLEEEIPVEENLPAEEPTNGPIYQLPSVEELEKEKAPEILELPVCITGVSCIEDTTNNTEETPKEEKTESTLPEESEEIIPEEPEQPEEIIPKDPEQPEEIIPEEPGQPEEIIPEEPEQPEEELPEDEKEPEDEEIEEAEVPLTVGVMLTLGEKTFSATFVINENNIDENAVGELKYCPVQYHPTVPITLTNNQDTDTILGDFPPMTKYTVGETSCILYDGGTVKIPAGEKLKLDLSSTQMKKDLEFYSFAGAAYTVKYEESPYEADNTTMIIVDGIDNTLPVSYQWGEITPVITTEHLTAGKEGLKWNIVDEVTYKEDNSGKIQMILKSPEAGTYRMKALWNEDEITLYQLELPFYVQCGSADQGGTGQ